MPTVAPQLLRSRLTKVCVAIIGSTAAEMIEKATSVVKETPFLEFRLDYLEKPLLALPKLKQFFADNTAATAIATCRRAANGGKFAGTIAAEVEILSKAAEAGFHLVDIELQSAESIKKAGLQKLRETGIALIVSYHDFNATRDLDGIYARIAPFNPDFVKIVPTAKALVDNVTLIRFLERMNDHTNIIGICMGDAGVISRVLGVRAGSAFTFAAATPGEETGPGQIAARTLIETYRIEHVDAATKVYGVAGNPIRSSLSPIMMNTAFRRETVNAVYLALQTTRLSDLLKLVHEIPIQGVSITMPLKQEILPHLEQTDPLSAKIGAVNTIRLLDGKLYGFNTDVAGIVGPLEKRISLRGAKVLVLGAGGAARAAVFGIRDRGAEVFILNRTAETAQKLARQSGSKTIKKEALAKTSFDAIINATPVGMAGNKAPQILEAKDLNTRLVFDLVYNPLETPLIHMARQQSIPIITGVEMFVQQGARQFEIFTGKPAPEEEMFRVVLHALRQQTAEAAAEAAEAPAPKPAKIAAAAKPAAKPIAKSKPPAKSPVKPAAKPAAARHAAKPPVAKKSVRPPAAKRKK
ncbi:MAG: shikimate dehydrogenase [Acidobacteriaceae bacterium]